MARITIEDCLIRIPNRFELTLAATNRARQISAGSQAMVDSDRDKSTVIALREIAADKVGIDMLLKPQAWTSRAWTGSWSQAKREGLWASVPRAFSASTRTAIMASTIRCPGQTRPTRRIQKRPWLIRPVRVENGSGG